MTTMLFLWIWIGGMMGPRGKVGFWTRFGWPMVLGMRLARWALDEGDRL